MLKYWLAREGREHLLRTTGSLDTGESKVQVPAAEKLAGHLADDRPPASVALLVTLGVGAFEFGIVTLDKPVERRLPRLPRTVSAGGNLSDIIVFEQYLDDFIKAGYRAMLPDGVHRECSSARVDVSQLEIDGQIRGERRQKNVAGYDRDVFRELAFCNPPDVHDPTDDHRFRSHLSKIVLQKVDKIVSIPVLKDHRSAGVTLALKNISYGLVNNVARNHVLVDGDGNAGGRTMNHCQTFIPTAVSLPPIHEKCVLQILDGLLGTYEGGLENWNLTFATWEYKSLFFATDPVALDHVGWEILDTKRAQYGWSSVARLEADAEASRTEQFHIRQPQHVPLAGLLGLDIFDESKIDHQRLVIG